MTKDAAFLTEVWELFKIYVPKKEKQEICYDLIRIFDENGMLDGVDESELTSTVRKAYMQFYDLGDSEDDYDELYDGDDE